MNRPPILWLLVLSLLFLAVGGLIGGIGMLVDASGRTLGMNDILPLLPVPDYTLPGLFLLFVMGLGPLFLSYGLLARPTWARAVSRRRGHHWSWTGTLALGVALVVWLLVQGLLIGFRWPIQYVTAVNGVLIIVLALVPSVRRAYTQ